MKDDYLWDKTGEPDTEIERLESALGRFRHRGTLDLSRLVRQAEPRIPARRWLWRIAAPAGLLALLALLWAVSRHPRPAPNEQQGWKVTRLAGTPRIGTRSRDTGEGPAKLGVGEFLQTDAASRASLSVDGLGEVQVEPNTRVRLVETAPSRKQIALDRGTIEASIWAPAGEFTVSTPSALAVDMGCVYTLHVDDAGAGLLRTSVGWVGFRLNGHDSFIPAGAACLTRPGVGPGTPYFEDAPESLRAALDKLDFDPGCQRQRELDLILGSARPRDALTLWHLLARVQEPERGRVYDRLARLAPPPEGVNRQGILKLDQPMLDAWWGKLGLGDISLWRHWERSWPDQRRGDRP